jgi:integrase
MKTKKTEFPMDCSRAGVIVKIYRHQRDKGDQTYTEYQVAFHFEGKRKLQSFADLKDAKARADAIIDANASRDFDVLSLKGRDLIIYRRSLPHLAASGTPLDVACERYASAVAKLGAVPLDKAVDFYVENCAGLQPRTVREVLDEFIALRKQRTKKGTPASQIYLDTLESRLGRFAKDFQGPIASVTGETIEEWLTGSEYKGRTRFNYVRLIKTLFKFAQAKRYFPRNVDPLENIESAFDDDGEIEVFTPEEMSRLLASARPELVPFLAIAAFAGLRSAEISRLDWSDVKDRFIEIKKSKAKTRSRRLVPIQPNLAKWLAPYRKPAGPVVPFANVPKQLIWLAESTAEPANADGTPGKPAVKWKHNALRHSFITYRMVTEQNENVVASEAGNSPGMIFKHYRELATPEAGKAWFAIAPESPANVVTMNAAAA